MPQLPTIAPPSHLAALRHLQGLLEHPTWLPRISNPGTFVSDISKPESLDPSISNPVVDVESPFGPCFFIEEVFAWEMSHVSSISTDAPAVLASGADVSNPGVWIVNAGSSNPGPRTPTPAIKAPESMEADLPRRRR